MDRRDSASQSTSVYKSFSDELSLIKSNGRGFNCRLREVAGAGTTDRSDGAVVLGSS